MRYILDKDGYIYDVSFGAEIECDLGTCTLYNGEVPNGYSTIEEWFEKEIDKLNAWKIVDGNLVYDENKYNELQRQYEQEQKDNSCVIHKELYDMQDQLKEIKSINEEQLIKQSEKDKVIAVDNVKKIYSKVKLTDINCYDYSNIDIISTNKNMLPNEAITKEIDDLKIKVNKDKSITLNGKCGTTETFTGTSIKINDGSDYKIDSLTIEGKSEQETREGKNLLYVSPEVREINGLTITKNEDGSITINGTSTAISYCNINTNYSDNTKNKYFTIEKDKSYTAYLDKPLAGLGLTVRTLSKNYAIVGTGVGNDIGTGDYNKDTDEYAFAYLGIHSDITFNNITIYPMVVEGKYTKDTIGEFEPYGAMPSPDYPSEINSIGNNGNISIKNNEAITIIDLNKDLFDKNNVEDSKIVVRTTGELTSNTSYYATDYIEVEPNTKYTEYGFNVWYTACYDENKTYISNVDNSTTFTTPENAKYIRMSLLKTNINIARLQKGEKIVDTELCSIGEVKDELSIKNGKTKINKKIGKIVLNGSEYWVNATSDNRNIYRMTLNDIKLQNYSSNVLPVTISNYFVGDNWYNLYQKNVDNAMSSHNSNHYLEIRSTKFSTVNELKTWLSTHNTTVYYELAEPYEIELDDCNIELFDGVNNISLDDDLDTNMETTCYTPKLIEYNIMGNSNNTEAFLCFKKNYNYYLSNSDLIIKMYNYDGTNREEVYSGTGGFIKFTDNDKLVTQSTLIIPTGTTFDNVTIYPQLEYGTSGSSYETPKYSKLSFDYSEYIEDGLFPSDDLYPSDTLYPAGTTIENIIIEDSKVTALINGEETEIANGNVSLFDGYNNVYTLQDTTLEMTYCIDVLVTEERISKIEKEQDSINIEVGKKVNNSDYTGAKILLKINEDESEAQIKADKIKLEGYTTINDGFSVDEQGNMSCNNATAKNVNIVGGNIKLTDDGTSSGLVLTSESDLSKIGIWSCGFYVYGKDVPEAEISNDMFAELGFRNGNMCLLIGGTDGYSSELTDYDLAFMSTDNDMTYINSHGVQTPKIYNSNDIVIIDSKINSPSTYNNTSTGTANMHITANGYFARSTSSSERYKKNIKDVSNKELDVNKLLEVPIRQYKYRDNYINKDDERYDKDIIGFIVEELEKYYPIAVDHNEDGTPEMWNSQIMIPAMLKLIQNQAKRIDELEKKVSDKNA